MLFTSTPKCVKSQNQLPFYNKMWNTSFYHEGCGWTGDIWIIPDKSESGTFNTFRCFRKLPQSSVCKWQWKWKDVYFSVSRRIFQKSQKMWDKVAQSLTFRPYPFPLHAGWTWSYCFTCADDHHGVLEFVELDLKPFFTITQWVKGIMASLRYLLILTFKSNPRDLWPLRHLIRVIRRHDLTQKDLPTYIPTQ